MARREARPGQGRPDAPAVPRLDLRRLRLSWLVLPASAFAALLVGAGMIAALGANPVTGYRALLDGAFGDSYALSATAVKAVPLLLVGVGICIAFRANVFNIGGEGQIAMGALAATATAIALPDLPAPALIPLTLVAGAVGGGLWGAIPGAFKGYLAVNEILTTIMLNLVAVQLMIYFLAGPMRDRTQGTVGGLIPQTRLLPESSLAADPRGRHAAAPRRPDRGPRRGRRLRAALADELRLPDPRRRPLARRGDATPGCPCSGRRCSRSRSPARCAGSPGAMLVFGSISHRMVTDGSLTGFTGSAGFNGIVVALFGGLNPLWTILSSFVFAGLLVGGDAMQVVTNVPSDLVVALNGLVVVFVVSTEWLRRRPRPAPAEPPEPTASEPAAKRIAEASA